MSNRHRQQRLMLWIIGALGIVAAIGLVAVLAWVLLLGPGKSATPTPSPTVPIVSQATDTPSAPSPTVTTITQASATATKPLPLPTRTKVVAESTAIIAAPTVTPMPTQTSTFVPTYIPTVISPTWTPVVPPTWTPVVPPPTPSPWAMVNTSSANVRAGPGTQYPVITQVHYGQYVLLLGQNAGYNWYYVQLQDGRLGWIAANLVNRAPGLALPIVPAPLFPPTPPPPPTNTPIPPWVPTWTPVPPPTWTPIPPPTSTFTPVPPPPCPILIGAPFIAPWTGEVRETLRCPTDTMRETWTAIQRFERGIMFWRGDQRMIYVIADDHTWRKIADNWVEGMNEYSCPDTPPGLLIRPKRGFGYVWCNEPGMKALVGWAVEEEHGFTTQFQAFEGGEMMRAENNTVYILKHSGWWQSYP